MTSSIRPWTVLCGLVLACTATGQVSAQVPAPPGVPGAPPAPGIPAAPAAPAAPQPTTLWSFLGISHENCDKCRERICKRPIGKMLNNMLMPIQFATGGLIGPLCPPGPSPEDLAKLTDPNNLAASPAQAVAAQIQADQATVKERIAAVRYLATVDCHYYPEAGDALIDSLRKDRNECVRYEAALALTRGCCCNKKTIAALILVVEGKDTDGNPSETSERVKDAATQAMSLCLGKVPYFPEEKERPEFPPPGPVPPEAAAATALGGLGRIKLTSYYTHYLPQVPSDTLIQQAGRIIAEAASARAQASAAPAPRGGLLPLWYDANAFADVREEISFDEAALAALGKPAGAVHPIAYTKKTLAPAPDAAPTRAGLGFQSAPTVQKTAGYAPAAAAPATPAMLPSHTNPGGPPMPVAWPLTGNAPAAGQPDLNRNLIGVNAGSPQPVPWPLAANVKR